MTITETGPLRGSLAACVTGSGPVRAHIDAHRRELRELLTEHGAVLLRGFDSGGAEGLDGTVRSFSGSAPLTYAERSSPRSTITGQVYTSTDYPADEEIFLHNENSYQAAWPLTLYFACLAEAHTEGATPLADIREVYRSLDPALREEFERRGWRVVRNFHGDFGVPWQETFSTSDRDRVAAYCRDKGLQVHWRPDGGLRTTALRQAVHTHPVTGDRVWFNHATFFHVTSLAPEVGEGLREIFPDEDLPTNTYYGDGGVIPDSVMDELRAAYRAASTRFDWRLGDVLVVDNMRAAHGREPFTGPRRIAVAMAEPSDAR
ncbi:TauD/TfdA family dioxygenase [Streptomyces sp. NPDC008313]|uniref:TauD/TfdA family dioxygenase n=1 Tax=Streptomyces sp. NPDC008313 TaxID=3364826 RepID=UPI0036E7BC6D